MNTTHTERHGSTLIDHCRQAARTALAAIALALIAACQPQPTFDGAPDADGLIEVKRSGMDAVAIDPGVDFGQYGKLLIDGLHFSNVDIVDPNGSHDPRYRKLTLSDDDKARMNQQFIRQMTKQLMKDGFYDITTQTGTGTLRVVTEVVRLAPTAPRESDEKFSASVRNETYTRGAGSMTLESRLHDSASGKLVAVLRDKLTDSELWGPNNSVTTNAAVQRAFTRWAQQLQRQLRQIPTP